MFILVLGTGQCRRLISALPTQRHVFGALAEPVASTATGLLAAMASVLR